MNRLNPAIVTLLTTIASWTLATAADAATIVVGPGTHPPIEAYAGLNDYHFLPGAQIVGPANPQFLPFSFTAREAVKYDGNGRVRFDGGEFRGGDATYTGPAASYAEVISGNAATIVRASLEIYGGQFQGGRAFSTSTDGRAHGGVGLLLIQSEATITGGTFKGGDLITPNAPYYPSNFPLVADLFVSASTVHLTGGRLGYVVVGTGSQLHIYGRGLQRNGFQVYGTLADRTPANITVYFDSSDVLFLHEVPEPTAALPALLAAFAHRS